MNFTTSYTIFKFCLKLKEIYIFKKFKNFNYVNNFIFFCFRFILYLRASSRAETDGLNSLNYKLVKIEEKTLFTRFYVSYSDK
jgi:hypothetical protein